MPLPVMLAISILSIAAEADLNDLNAHMCSLLHLMKR